MSARLPAPDRASFTWVGWLLPLGVVVALAVGTGQANRWAIINFGLLVVGWGLSVALHEAGHAIAARLLGFDVHWLAIGSGPRIASPRVGGTSLLISALPFSGAVLATTRRRPGLRRRLTVMMAAGTFVNLLGAAVGLLGSPGHLVEAFVAPAPFAVLAGASILALRQVGVAGMQEGVVTDLRLIVEVANASEEDLDLVFQGHLEKNDRWRSAVNQSG